jgi:hypothetical protein
VSGDVASLSGEAARKNQMAPAKVSGVA